MKKEKGITRKELDALTGNRAENVASQAKKKNSAIKGKKKFGFAK